MTRRPACFLHTLLPLLLTATVVLGLGSYFETSDDEHFALLFSGATAASSKVPAKRGESFMGLKIGGGFLKIS